MTRSTLRNITRTATIAALAGAALPAAAGNFNWSSAQGNWSDHANWAGPVGLTPGFSDIAIVSGNNAWVNLTGSTVVGGLSIMSEGTVSQWNINAQAPESLLVHGTLAITDDGAINVRDAANALNDLDVDALLLSGGGRIYTTDGTTQIDEAATITNNSVIWGTGVVEMNSTTGDLNLTDGTLLADGAGSSTDLLTIRRSANSTSVLDWTSPDANLRAWYDADLHIQIPVQGAFGGAMNISGSSRITIDHAWIGQAGATVSFWSDGSDTPLLTGAPADIYGTVSVLDRAAIDVPLLALRDQVNIDDGHLTLTNNVILDTADFNGINGPSSVYFFDAGTTTITGGGTTWINMDGGIFDLDGPGNRTVNITAGSTLYIANTSLDGDDYFDGTLNVDGEAVFSAFNAESFNSTGTVTVGPDGHINGRELVNTEPGELIFNGGSTATAGFRNEGDMTVNAVATIAALNNHAIFDSNSTTTLDADLTVDADILARNGASFAGDSTLRVAPGASLDFDPNATVNVDVHSDGDLTIADNIISFNPLVSEGTMKSLDLTENASMKVEFVNDTADHYNVTGDVVIKGELIVWSVGNEWQPAFGDSATVISAANVTGEFSFVDDSALGDCYRAFVSYEADRVNVTILNAADVNQDGIVSPADFTAWLFFFDNDDMRGDVNKDGTLSPADFTKWLQLFNQGC